MRTIVVYALAYMYTTSLRSTNTKLALQYGMACMRVMYSTGTQAEMKVCNQAWRQGHRTMV